MLYDHNRAEIIWRNRRNLLRLRVDLWREQLSTVLNAVKQRVP